jgi:hypothetical protein
MQITLKKLHYAAFASQESPCFQADVYIDGRREGQVSNEGHGGAHRIHPNALEDRLNAHAAALPRRLSDPSCPDSVSYQPTGEDLLTDALDRALAERDLKRLLRTRLVFLREAKVYQTARMAPDALASAVADLATRGKLRAEALLNALPFNAALDLYAAHAATPPTEAP